MAKGTNMVQSPRPDGDSLRRRGSSVATIRDPVGDEVSSRRPVSSEPGAVRSVPADTPAEVQRMLDERWRAATPAEKATLVDALFRDCTAMALTGIRLQHPDATPDEVRYQLALRRYGREVADLYHEVAPDR